ncbi:amine sulfotransferase-like [Echeneis naucrates]|nr:amine sulfotransferase-like [Echeneis naucrates]
MDSNHAETHNDELVLHRGFTLIRGTHDPDDVDQIKHLEIRDSDVFVATYPKSGTIWLQQILLLVEAKGDVTAIRNPTIVSNADIMPWMESIGTREMFITAPSPRMRVTHLQPQFMPLALSQRGKVIYVARNPKDVLVSYFYFHKMAKMLETPKDFNDFFEKFLRGDLFGCSWFDHIKAWYSVKDEMNMLFFTFEEMIQDLKSVVQRISLFLGKDLTNEEQANVVKHSTFKKMKDIPQANYKQVSEEMFNHQNGMFMRKGTIGDWKNHFTVAQNERFDQVFQKEMKDFPVSFIWDIKDIE